MTFFICFVESKHYFATTTTTATINKEFLEWINHTHTKERKRKQQHAHKVIKASGKQHIKKRRRKKGKIFCTIQKDKVNERKMT